MSVLVTHPGRQHSHRLAQALHAAELLSGYWTGIPTNIALKPQPFRYLLQKTIKYDDVPLPKELVSYWLWNSILRKLLKNIFSTNTAIDFSHRSDELFDLWSARRLEKMCGISAIVAYENAAEKTFLCAKKRSIVRVLDAASLHHSTQDKYFPFSESPTAHARICERKDREISLADFVIVTSTFAEESYLDAGVNPSKLLVIPLGCDTSVFYPPEGAASQELPIRFIFAGRGSKSKGIDILLSSLRRLDNLNIRFSCSLIGNVDKIYRDEFLKLGVKIYGQTRQAELAKLMQAADCLVLPSRFDSFGMVVVEAMASGLPVIVSDRVGAKQAVTEGRSGWVVSLSDPSAFENQMIWCAKNIDKVRAMRAVARSDASGFSWSNYGEKITSFIQSVLAR